MSLTQERTDGSADRVRLTYAIEMRDALGVATKLLLGCTSDEKRGVLLDRAYLAMAMVGTCKLPDQMASIPRVVADELADAIRFAAPRLIHALPPLVDAKTVRRGLTGLVRLTELLGPDPLPTLERLGGEEGVSVFVQHTARLYQALDAAKRREAFLAADLAKTRGSVAWTPGSAS